MKNYYPNVSICNEGCEFNVIDLESERIICKCNINYNNNINDIESNEIENNESYLDYFLSFINYKFILCYKLFYYIGNYYYNYGLYISFVILIFYFILITFFLIYGFIKFRLFFPRIFQLS